MSSTTNQFFDVANLRMLDRILRKAGFRGGEIYAIDEKEIDATNFLIQYFHTGIIDETALKSALKMYLASQSAPGPLPQATDDGSLSRWQDDGGAAAKTYKLTHAPPQNRRARHRSQAAIAFR
ncbi:hypothetical protein [Rhizobium miluonense]|uniref:Uncharacterized protein n=1 Tax=Rhizobium miluonense TaxID=411945 RepID=A0A1C3XDU7_9HYPH|nr:hypothetical protein [Rhizobium miluonense]SCB50433.1 hypothetical protein GA0061102_10895 [Rhizobium miluonense]